MKKLLLFVLVGFCFQIAKSQVTFPVNGVWDERESYIAYTNGKIYIDYQTIIENGTLIVKNGLVANVGLGIDIPKESLIIDLKGKYIYPSFIDPYTNYGMPKNKKNSSDQRWNKDPQYLSKKDGAYNWNQAIKPETNASELFKIDSAEASKFRKMGFGSVLSFVNDGIARGSSVLVDLSETSENEVIIKEKTAAHYSFNKGSSTQDYPQSLMGAIALLRQTYADAVWNDQEKNLKEKNISLLSWNDLQNLPQIFEVNDKLSALRADNLGDEFNVQYIIKGNGDEYQRINEIKKAGATFIIPVNYPKPYDVEDPYDALKVSLDQLKHWEHASKNSFILENAGIEFAFTSTGLKEKNEFLKNIKKAIRIGLSEKAALKALTYTPAKMLNVLEILGSLNVGKKANFIITSGNIFDDANFIYQNRIGNEYFEMVALECPDIRGNYEMKIGNFKPLQMEIKGEFSTPEVVILSSDTGKVKADFKIKNSIATIVFKSEMKEFKGVVRLSGWIENEKQDFSLKGDGQLPNGDWIKWIALKKVDFIPEKKKDIQEALELSDLTYPFTAFGFKELPEAVPVIFKNATVWTNTEEGTLMNTDVAVNNGKIIAIGTNINPSVFGAISNVEIINAKDFHLTSGIIDEHSHIAISKGVNEGTQASSAEVRIGDVIDSDDINIYRQLAGGVTSAQLLHGSANPIGGQSAIIKLRWGKSPEDLKFQDADGFIKFALGENVKQANWGDKHISRFPQTRMGVEQVYYDYFTRAKEYQNSIETYNKLSNKQQSKELAPRTDYEMDALTEILQGTRFITCHSYVQSEINMLMTVADSIGFKVNTFTHILEGYKVADKMKKYGVGASTFSDWWAYKYEVIDAIPYNGALLNKMDIVTAYNSDDAEMGRRLNQEAAKAVKYGATSEEDAWKFVTLNPAKLLHIDNRVGTIEPGKDADIVLWTENPLSIYAKVKKTYVDGICYYDSEKDEELRVQNNKERARIIQKMIEAKKKGEKTQKVESKSPHEYQCDDIGEYVGKCN